MATIRDVAERAGVSTATVSRALNDRGYCSGAVRERVRAAAEALGYVPNAMARGLKTRQSRLIGLLAPDPAEPAFCVVAQEVERVAAERGFQVLLGIGRGDPAREEASLDQMLARNVDGLLIAPAGAPDAPVRRAVAAGIAAVVIADALGEPVVDAVRADNVGGSRQLAAHLLGLGHRRIALVNGRATSTAGREREQGFREAHAEAGAPIDESLIRHGGWETDDAAGLVAALLREPARPTAIVAASAPLAVGAMRALRAAGCRVPEDVALTSFDDVPLAAEFDPFLTTVVPPTATIGRLAATMLLDRIAGDVVSSPREIVVPVTIEVRRSCGARSALWRTPPPLGIPGVEVMVAG